MEQQFPSKLLDQAVEQFAKLPGIGTKTALRFALFLLKQDEEMVDTLTDTLRHFRHDIRYCKVCHNLSDTEVCPICGDPRRDRSTICVVENIRDVMAIEYTQQYHGLYHVLGGVISPMDGVGPANLEIDSLVNRVAEGGVGEVIFALSPTMEGDTTNFYLHRKLAGFEGLKLSVIARGISVGDELEYIDEVTLGRSILNRVAFEGK